MTCIVNLSGSHSPTIGSQQRAARTHCGSSGTLARARARIVSTNQRSAIDTLAPGKETTTLKKSNV